MFLVKIYTSMEPNPEIDSHIYGQLAFDERTKAIQC